ncbi:brachyurin [Anabrus simplex]|uniref:brachyurin n=1 Tax=Anabrus simplex TaxID=316456 RepID=UPI0034DD119F
MKFVLALVVLVAAAQAEDWTHLQRVSRVMPTDPTYTWDEWQEIMANQEVKEQENAVYEGTEPQPADAGVSHAAIDGRVIGGSAASRGQFPWQAAIRLDSVSFCGGSLISSNYVLTAAHCTDGISTFTITLGATSISSTQSGAITQSTRNKIQHSSYNANTINNDISLLRLTSAVSSSTYISPVRLPRSSQASQDFAGSAVRISGWGRTSSNSGVSSTLNYADLTVITNTNCARYFGSVINSSKICTTGVNGRSPCNGDSGGPLVVLESDGRYTEVGVVSFGANGCPASYPAAFTRVTSYLSWISSNAGIAIRS